MKAAPVEPPAVAVARLELDAIAACETARTAIYAVLSGANAIGTAAQHWPTWQHAAAVLGAIIDPGGPIRAVAVNEVQAYQPKERAA